MQGNYFASPAAQLQPEHACDDLFERLFRNFRLETAEFYDLRRVRLEPYIAALADAGFALSAGSDPPSARRGLLNLRFPHPCSQVAGAGSQIGAGAEAESIAACVD